MIAAALLAFPLAGPAAAQDAFVFPVSGTISAIVGDCRPLGACSRAHLGYDIGGSRGTSIVAASSGVAYAYADNGGDNGNWVEVRHSSGYVTQYLHLDRLSVSSGQAVAQGQQVGTMGSTGADGIAVHLHFGILDRTAGRNTDRRRSETWNTRDGAEPDGVYETSLGGSAHINLNDRVTRGLAVTAKAPIPFEFPGVTPPVRAAHDFNGDGKTDMGVVRPENGTWHWMVANAAGATQLDVPQFGTTTDVPLQGDFDGNGRADVAVWRPSTGQWFQWNGTGNTVLGYWGTTGDRPISGDFNGDGKTDMAIVRPENGTWHWMVANAAGATQLDVPQFGTTTDIPLQGDFDGNGRADVAVWRPSTGQWFQWNGGNNVLGYWGTTGDRAIPGITN
jgi:hypothetical protein